MVSRARYPRSLYPTPFTLSFHSGTHPFDNRTSTQSQAESSWLEPVTHSHNRPHSQHQSQVASSQFSVISENAIKSRIIDGEPDYDPAVWGPIPMGKWNLGATLSFSVNLDVSVGYMRSSHTYHPLLMPIVRDNRRDNPCCSPRSCRRASSIRQSRSQNHLRRSKSRMDPL